MWIDILILISGGIGVWLGAEGMVRGACKLAEYFGVSALVVGLTVVAFGTSAPEWVVSSVAAFKGHSEMALGNAMGSNIINIALVLGISAIIAPVRVSKRVFKRDLPIVFVITLIVVGFIQMSGEINRIEGVILLLLLVGYLIYSYQYAKREQARITMAPGWTKPPFKIKHLAWLLGGIVILAAGAEFMVRGAVGVAESFGISKRIIGMTIVAFGTSVPELAASVVAARHGEADLAIGNVVGSNIFNATLILGTASLISPIQSSLTWLSPDIIFFIVTVAILFPLVRIGWRIGRTDGIILLVTYILAMFFIFV